MLSEHTARLRTRFIYTSSLTTLNYSITTESSALAKLHLRVLLSLQDCTSGFLYEPSLLKGAHLIRAALFQHMPCHRC
jgi:hypothetical protein